MTKPTADESNARRKTPRERAQELVDAKDRKIARLTDKAAGLRSDVAEVDRDLDLAKRQRAYLAASPDLEDADQLAIPVDEETDEGDV